MHTHAQLDLLIRAYSLTSSLAHSLFLSVGFSVIILILEEGIWLRIYLIYVSDKFTVMPKRGLSKDH